MTNVVIATAGHVDHGKSTLVGALTGIDTDRWAEEKRRGLTIDLGFAWTQLGEHTVSVVDVPGHERFLGNMLAGLGPAPIVLFVVAADEGWQQQSSDHRDAVAALGIQHGIIVLTKTDLTTGPFDGLIDHVRSELAGTGLSSAPVVPVSARTGQGLDELREALISLISEVPQPPETGRVRLWVDRAFTISGAGTVVTGTLGTGTLSTGDAVQIVGEGPTVAADIRSLQSREESVPRLGPVNRAAVNLRGVSADALHRGSALITPNTWHLTDVVDVRTTTAGDLGELPRDVTVHVGSASVSAHARPLGADHARLTLPWPLPLQIGDAMVLRTSGERPVVGGVRILDVDPPALTRRGDGARRTAALQELPDAGSMAAEVERRGVVRTELLRRFGYEVPTSLPAEVIMQDGWLIHRDQLSTWSDALRQAVTQEHARNELAGGLTLGAARDQLSLPDAALLPLVVQSAELTIADGRIRTPGTDPTLGAAESAVAQLERRLETEPFLAPEAHELQRLGLGPRELAAAHKQKRLLRLPGDVVLLPIAPALAMREIAQLPQPFTLSQARQALGTTRRVAVPLLELLDQRGWTRRVDGTLREVAR